MGSGISSNVLISPENGQSKPTGVKQFIIESNSAAILSFPRNSKPPFLPPIIEQPQPEIDGNGKNNNITSDNHRLLTIKYETLLNHHFQLEKTIRSLKPKVCSLLHNINELQVIALRNNLQEKVITQVVVSSKAFVVNIKQLEDTLKQSLSKVEVMFAERDKPLFPTTPRTLSKSNKNFSFQCRSSCDYYLLNREFESLRKTIKSVEKDLHNFDLEFDVLTGEIALLTELCAHKRNWGTRFAPPETWSIPSPPKPV